MLKIYIMIIMSLVAYTIFALEDYTSDKVVIVEKNVTNNVIDYEDFSSTHSILDMYYCEDVFMIMKQYEINMTNEFKDDNLDGNLF